MFKKATKFSDRDKAEACADRLNAESNDGWSYKVRCVQHKPQRLWIVAVYNKNGQHVGEL